MPRLPIRPLIFVPAYLGPFLVLFVVTFVGGTVQFWPVLAVAVLQFALHLVWLGQAARFAAAQSGQDEGQARARLELAGAVGVAGGAGMFLVCGIAALAWLPPHDAAPVERMLHASADVIGAAAVALILVFHWLVARTICVAEAAQRIRAPGVVVTTISLLYIFIAAPFLYERLKKLGGGSAESALLTA